jgi:hypothetical protein
VAQPLLARYVSKRKVTPLCRVCRAHRARCAQGIRGPLHSRLTMIAQAAEKKRKAQQKGRAPWGRRRAGEHAAIRYGTQNAAP